MVVEHKNTEWGIVSSAHPPLLDSVCGRSHLVVRAERHLEKSPHLLIERKSTKKVEMVSCRHASKNKKQNSMYLRNRVASAAFERLMLSLLLRLCTTWRHFSCMYCLKFSFIKSELGSTPPPPTLIPRCSTTKVNLQFPGFFGSPSSTVSTVVQEKRNGTTKLAPTLTFPNYMLL